MLIRDSSTSNPDAEKAVLALENISLTIRAGEKIAICGRTGRYIHPPHHSNIFPTNTPQWKIFPNLTPPPPPKPRAHTRPHLHNRLPRHPNREPHPPPLRHHRRTPRMRLPPRRQLHPIQFRPQQHHFLHRVRRDPRHGATHPLRCCRGRPRRANVRRPIERRATAAVQPQARGLSPAGKDAGSGEGWGCVVAR